MVPSGPRAARAIGPGGAWGAIQTATTGSGSPQRSAGTIARFRDLAKTISCIMHDSCIAST